MMYMIRISYLEHWRYVMHKTLLVIAAGLSTRFGGKPKHLAIIDEETVIENTLSFAKQYYDNIYIAINCQASEQTIETTRNIAKLFDAHVCLISSGKGDADAVYRTLCDIDELNDKNVSVCWGDAIFKDDFVFKTASSALEINSKNTTFNAMCAIERNPYGWFDLDTDGTIISSAVFANDCELKKNDKRKNKVHDQCFFNINVKNFMKLFKAYEKDIKSCYKSLKCDMSEYSSSFKFNLNYEISWYKMINWAKCQAEYCDNKIGKPSMVTILNKPVALSFNTLEDLKEIEKHA